MKKIILICIILIFSIKVKSQIIESIYQRSGITISKIDWNVLNSDVYTQSVSGLTTGFGISYLQKKYWNLDNQLIVFPIGGKDRVDLVDANGNKIEEQISRFFFNYLSFNTTIQIHYPFDFMIPSLKIGPRIDYLLWSNLSSDIYEKFNYGFDIGAAINKTLNNKLILGFEIIHNLHLNKIAKTDNLSIESKNGTSIIMGIGYKL